tara:strand:+ start:5512 stop:5640 length:129 start_codon:yes stop_codon:yes gene_type:complete
MKYRFEDEIEVLLDVLPEDYFMKDVLQNINDLDEERFGEDKE